MTATPSIYPALILARITKAGRLSAPQLVRILKCSTRTVNCYIAQLRADGKIEQIYLGRGQCNDKRYAYAVPVKHEYARIGATQYLPMKPTGTTPLDINGTLE